MAGIKKCEELKKANTDYLRIDETLLSEEEKFTRESVRKFIKKHFLPIVRECYLNEVFPLHLMPYMGSGELGLFGMTFDEEKYGGCGANYVQFGIANYELGRGDDGLQLGLIVQHCLTMFPIYRCGSQEQKDQYLPGMAEGRILGCFGLTEPNVGSDPSSIKTVARKSGHHYYITGEKTFITMGEAADFAIIWCKLENGQIRGFLVPTDSPGFTSRGVAPHQEKTAIRISITSQLTLEDVKVHKDRMMPGAKKLGSILECLTQGRYGIANSVIGAASVCYELAHNYAIERIQFKRPIAEYQLTQQKLAIMQTELSLAQLANIQVGRLLDKGKATHDQVSMLKFNNTHKALKIARLARKILAGSSIDLGTHVMRHLANLELADTYEGTNDIQMLTMGRGLTGVDAIRKD